MENLLPFLDTAFLWLFRTSLESTAVAVVILLAQLVFRNKLEARWRYALWMVVMARLILPFTPPSPSSLFNYVPAPSQDFIETLTATVTEINENLPETISPTTESATITKKLPRVQITTLRIMACLWLLGAILFATRILKENLRFWRQLKQSPDYALDPCTELKLRTLLAQCQQQTRINRSLPMIITPVVNSPALYGCFRPSLLLPPSILTSINLDQLRYVFLHELAHLKRHDLLINTITTFLQIVHWFNPILAFAFYRIRKDREPACDARALQHLQPHESISYGNTLLDLMKTGQPQYVPGMAGILEDSHQLKRRIAMIASFNQRSYRLSLLAALLLVSISAMGLTRATRKDDSMEAQRWYPAFSKTYALSEGQALNLITEPYIPERAKFFDWIDTDPETSTCAFRIDNGKIYGFYISATTCQYTENGRTQYAMTAKIPLDQLLPMIMPLSYSTADYVIPESYAKKTIPPGDWVVDFQANKEAILASLEPVLRNAWNANLHFEHKEMERNAIIISGQFEYHGTNRTSQKPIIKFYADPPESQQSGIGGGSPPVIRTTHDFALTLQNYTRIPVIDESNADIGNTAYDVWCVSIEPQELSKPETLDKILGNLTQQTNLAFKLEKRRLPCWTITETPIPSTN